MEPPARFAADSVRAGKAELLDSIDVPGRDEALRNAVRAQYGDGYIDNKAVEPYRRTKDVDPNSTTETYVALKLMIDNWRWAGVPFYLRTGKALRTKLSEVAINSSRRRSRCFATRRSIAWRRISWFSGIQYRTNISALKFNANE